MQSNFSSPNWSATPSVDDVAIIEELYANNPGNIWCGTTNPLLNLSP